MEPSWHSAKSYSSLREQSSSDLWQRLFIHGTMMIPIMNTTVITLWSCSVVCKIKYCCTKKQIKIICIFFNFQQFISHRCGFFLSYMDLHMPWSNASLHKLAVPSKLELPWMEKLPRNLRLRIYQKNLICRNLVTKLFFHFLLE